MSFDCSFSFVCRQTFRNEVSLRTCIRIRLQQKPELYKRLILYLNYSENSINPLYVAMNDFRFLMPPITILPYTCDSIAGIVMDIRHASGDS